MALFGEHVVAAIRKVALTAGDFGFLHVNPVGEAYVAPLFRLDLDSDRTNCASRHQQQQ